MKISDLKIHYLFILPPHLEEKPRDGHLVLATMASVWTSFLNERVSVPFPEEEVVPMICEEPGASSRGLSGAQIGEIDSCILHVHNIHGLTQAKHTGSRQLCYHLH